MRFREPSILTLTLFLFPLRRRSSTNRPSASIERADAGDFGAGLKVVGGGGGKVEQPAAQNSSSVVLPASLGP